MSAYPPPTNGYFNGATYNSAYFVDSDSTGVTMEFLEENYLPRVGNPTDVAESTYFQGEIIEGQNIILTGTQDQQYIQYPNGSQQFTAPNILTPSSTFPYANIETDANGQISSITAATYGTFYTDIILEGAIAIEFPNGSEQTTAMNTLPVSQTYTYATVTTDENGAINSITSNTIPTSPSLPVQYATAYGTYTSSYISFTLNTSGSTTGPWAQNQFFTIQYTFSVYYNAASSTPNQFQNSGNATGTMDIYPYRFGSNWCANANAPSLGQIPNSINGNSNFNMVDTGTNSVGGVIAPSGREFWSYGYVTTGTNVFYIHGNKSSLVFQVVNPSGWTSGASFTYNIIVELLYTGANKSSITTSGFNQNF